MIYRIERLERDEAARRYPTLYVKDGTPLAAIAMVPLKVGPPPSSHIVMHISHDTVCTAIVLEPHSKSSQHAHHLHNLPLAVIEALVELRKFTDAGPLGRLALKGRNDER